MIDLKSKSTATSLARIGITASLTLTALWLRSRNGTDRKWRTTLANSKIPGDIPSLDAKTRKSIAEFEAVGWLDDEENWAQWAKEMDRSFFRGWVLAHLDNARIKLILWLAEQYEHHLFLLVLWNAVWHCHP